MFSPGNTEFYSLLHLDLRISGFLRYGRVLRVKISRVSRPVGRYRFPAQRAVGPGKPLHLQTEKGAYRGVERGFRAKIFAQSPKSAPSLHFYFREISDFKALYQGS